MICKRIGGFNPEECDVAGMGPDSGETPACLCLFPRPGPLGDCLGGLPGNPGSGGVAGGSYLLEALCLECWGQGRLHPKQDFPHPKGKGLPLSSSIPWKLKGALASRNSFERQHRERTLKGHRNTQNIYSNTQRLSDVFCLFVFF